MWKPGWYSPLSLAQLGSPREPSWASSCNAKPLFTHQLSSVQLPRAQYVKHRICKFKLSLWLALQKACHWSSSYEHLVEVLGPSYQRSNTKAQLERSTAFMWRRSKNVIINFTFSVITLSWALTWTSWNNTGTITGRVMNSPVTANGMKNYIRLHTSLSVVHYFLSQTPCIYRCHCVRIHSGLISHTS